MISTNKLAKDSIIYSISEILTRSIGFFLIPIFTHYFSPDEYGIYSVSIVIMQILVIIVGLGLGSYILRGYVDFSNIQERKRFVGSIFIVLLFFSLVFSLLLDHFGSKIFQYIFQNVPFRPFLRYTVWIAFFKVFFLTSLMLFIVKGESVKVSIMSIFNSLIVIGLVIYLVTFKKQGVEGSLKGYLLGFLIFFIITIIVIRKDLSLQFQFKYVKPALLFGIPLVPHSIAGWINNFADRILIERYCDLAALGIYSLGYQLGLILYLINNAINKAWVPFFYKVADQEDAANRLRHITQVYFGIILFIGLGISVFSREIIVLISKPTYFDAYKVIPFVSAASVFHGFYYLTSVSILYRKKTKFFPLLTGIAGSISIILNLILLPKIGYIGAAYATSISFFCLCSISYFISRRMYVINFALGRMIAIFLVACLLFLVSQATHDLSIIVSIPIKIALMLIFLSFLFIFKIFTNKEILTFRNIVQLKIFKIDKS